MKSLRQEPFFHSLRRRSLRCTGTVQDIHPTAGAAIGSTMRDYRQERRRAWEKEHEIKTRRKAYIVSPYAGDVEKNTKDTVRYCRYAVKQGYIPVAAHLIYPQILDDRVPEERAMGLMFGLSLLDMCDEVWIFARRDAEGQYILSDGMKKEYNREYPPHQLQQGIKTYSLILP